LSRWRWFSRRAGSWLFRKVALFDSQRNEGCLHSASSWLMLCGWVGVRGGVWGVLGAMSLGV
jgi:hypothetical protein